MIDNAVHPADDQTAEALLRAELARGDAMADSVLPILQYLLAAEDSALFSDEILARVRGMVADMARQIVEQLFCDSAGPGQFAEDIEDLSRAFMADSLLLAHVHALALEWQMTERLQSRLALDPVVAPLVQAMIASAEGTVHGLAVSWLAAQARWCQAQRRMSLPLEELPGDLLHRVLLAVRGIFGAGKAPLAIRSGETGTLRDERSERLALAEAAIRRQYDEGSTRLGLASRLLTGLGGASHIALSVSHAGVALFLTALASGSGLRREAAVLATHEAQLARLALALRAAGLKAADIEKQFLAIHPEAMLPEGFERLGADVAASILASGRQGG
ncbi:MULTISPECIES: hypothetical protein [Novosphingobium]|uniref:DUF2336 domain-containing protein n=1 Tax=Novosphingobium pentaromativorans TaxID=205844 RepID=A0A2W5QR02_9SPHN|nr:MULTISPECIES: hypothetical protein [Novosphingobium]PZQ53910.1 MAG: hypothetical protein DI555_14345 [Novosphingobium pentaromativorans]GFE74255.1 hypothetical protein NTCA1_19040 [Novosphingobium sp. TCA1]